MTKHINPTDYAAIARLALRDDASESASKGRGRVRTLAAIYVANTNASLSNLALTSVAMLESKSEKGAAYAATFDRVFTGGEDVKLTNTMKNKLKLGLDVLAYVSRMEAKHKVEMLRINDEGDVIRVRETLLDPDVSPSEANWYSTDSKAKTKTSVDELARAARKHMLDQTGEALPQASNGDDVGSRAGRKGKNEGDKTATTLHGMSLIEAADLLSGQIQTAQAKADNKLAGELREALETLRAVITDALVANEQARTRKAA